MFSFGEDEATIKLDKYAIIPIELYDELQNTDKFLIFLTISILCLLEKEKEEKINSLAQLISEQFSYTFNISLLCVRESVYKEAAKRWMNRMKNCCKKEKK